MGIDGLSDGVLFVSGQGYQFSAFDCATPDQLPLAAARAFGGFFSNSLAKKSSFSREEKRWKTSCSRRAILRTVSACVRTLAGRPGSRARSSALPRTAV